MYASATPYTHVAVPTRAATEPRIGIAPKKLAPATTDTTKTPTALSVWPFTSWPTPGMIALHTAGTMPLPPPPPLPDRLTNALDIVRSIARFSHVASQRRRPEAGAAP